MPLFPQFINVFHSRKLETFDLYKNCLRVFYLFRLGEYVNYMFAGDMCV